MIKTAGFIIVILTTTIFGFILSEDIITHYKQLSLVIRMLDVTRIRLEYNLSTREELFGYIFSKKEYEFFKADNLKKSKLSENEKRMLLDFYNQLGTTDLQGQLSQIEMFKRDFDYELSELKKTKDNRCRLFRTGGALVGVFVCLLLV